VLQIVREALTNVEKHAQAHAVSVELAGGADGSFRVVIDDDGVGIATETSPAQHFGLDIMRDRAGLLGGSIEIGRSAGSGTGCGCACRRGSASLRRRGPPRRRPEKRNRLNMESRNTVLVVDDHPLFRKGVVQLLAMEPSIEVVGEAGNRAQALALVQQHEPDLTLLDLNLKSESGLDILAAIKADDPSRRAS